MPGSPVVMMIHGLAGQAHVFDAIANQLAGKYHVYCLDVRGRGESAWGPPGEYGIDTYVADLEAIREALGLQRMSLVGTSMGGIITMHYAPKYPERVARAVLNDIGPEIDPEGLKRIISYVGGAPEMFADMKAVVRYYKEHYAPMVEHLPTTRWLSSPGTTSERAIAESTFGRWTRRYALRPRPSRRSTRGRHSRESSARCSSCGGRRATSSALRSQHGWSRRYRERPWWRSQAWDTLRCSAKRLR